MGLALIFSFSLNSNKTEQFKYFATKPGYFVLLKVVIIMFFLPGVFLILSVKTLFSFSMGALAFTERS